MLIRPAIFLVLIPLVANAQSIMSIVNAARVSTYIGPGDLGLPTPSMFYSLRGYSGSYAGPGGNPAVSVRRQSDNVLKDIVILSNGNLDSAGAAAFAGIDATATCSTTGLSVTLACTSASSTPNVGDTLSGTGITQPAYLTACGAFTAGAGSCTMNKTQNIGAAETVTFQVGLFIRKAYDQIQGLKCGSATCDAVATVNGNQPLLLLNCLNSGTLPCISGSISGSPTLGTANNFTPASGVKTLVVVGLRLTANSSTALRVANGNRITFPSGATTNAWTLTGAASGAFNATASDGAAHAGVGVVNGASSNLYIDNVSTPGTATGNITAGATTMIGTIAVIQLDEAFVYDNVAFSSGQVSTLHTNQAAYWGTP